MAMVLGRCLQVPKALTSAQLSAMVGSADSKNEFLVHIAAYVATVAVDPDRAVTQCLLEWSNVTPIVDEDGLMIGLRKTIGIDKRSRNFEGKVKDTPCASDCLGNVELDENGMIDATKLCPCHLLQYAKVQWARRLGVRVEDVKGQLFADMFVFLDIPKGQTFVAWDAESPGFQMKAVLEANGVHVITRAEEKTCGKKSGLCFEVEGQPYATRPWGDAQQVTRRLRNLVVAAAKQARTAGAASPFGDAYRVKDFVHVLSS